MTQINYNKISIGPVKLGPSIQEGELGVHSLLSSGPHPAEPIFRTAPILLSAPRIGGNNIIPNTLSVVSFGVYQASPQPQFEIQWLRNDVDIVGETGMTYESVPADNDAEISVRVTATSQLGTITSESNIIDTVLYEPISMLELENYVVTGIGQTQRIHAMNVDYMYISGMAQQDSQINATWTGYYISGMAQESTLISIESTVYIITEEAAP